MDEDKYLLHRFVQAQAGVYKSVLAELQAGRKTTHWMWFVFPQLQGLGSSEMAQRYALKDADEARAYLQHYILGARLLECCHLLKQHTGKSAENIFGYTDAMKLRSCLTLFSMAVPQETIFSTLLDQYFGGRPDDLTIRLLQP